MAVGAITVTKSSTWKGLEQHFISTEDPSHSWELEGMNEELQSFYQLLIRPSLAPVSLILNIGRKPPYSEMEH